MCSFKLLTFKFDFDIIKIEHRFLSSIVCLFNYNFGASYALFQYLFLIIPHFSVMRDFVLYESYRYLYNFILYMFDAFVCEIHFTVILRHYNMGVK